MFMQSNTAFTAAEAVRLDALVTKTAPARSGMVAGTRVEAASGWRPVESLMRGDAVYTFDGGLRQITGIRRDEVTPARALYVPGGALDNCAAMTLLPGQHMLIEHPVAEPAFGSSLVLVPAAALVGHRGIEWARRHEPVEILTLCFDEEEIVYGNTGALFHCPASASAGGGEVQSGFFTVLGMEQAQALVGLMTHGDPFALAA